MCAEIISKELAYDMLSDSEELCTFEEFATLWLWAYPQLLEWNSKIQWLFSPVIGKDKYPGDLWGVDGFGQLILVETKLAKLGRKTDPFEDFVGFEEKLIVDQTRIPTREKVWRRFKDLLKHEMEFFKKYGLSLSEGNLPNGTFEGIVPYSSQRFAVRHWSHLYLQVIAPQFLNEQFVRAAEIFLEKYSESKDQIHYIGFVAIQKSISDPLSSAGKRSLKNLYKIAGMDRSHFVTIQAERNSVSEIRLITRKEH